MTDLSWAWEIERSGSGPHYYLYLGFGTSEADLERLVAPLLSQHYERLERAHMPRLWMHKDSGEWRYLSVEIRRGMLEITRGWGSVAPSGAEFVEGLLSTNSNDLVQWRVVAEGEGYGPQYFHSGTDVASFLAYCRCEVQRQSFPEVLRQLQESMMNAGLSEKYMLDKPEFESGVMKVPVLYDVPLVNGGWQCEPAASELIPIAREVSDKCGIPASASRCSRHAPNDFDKVIGGTFYFGTSSRE